MGVGGGPSGRNIPESEVLDALQNGEDFTIRENDTLTLTDNLTVPAGRTLTIEGTIDLGDGNTFQIDGTVIISGGTVTNESAAITVTGSGASLTMENSTIGIENSSLTVFDGGQLKLLGRNSITVREFNLTRDAIFTQDDTSSIVSFQPSTIRNTRTEITTPIMSLEGNLTLRNTKINIATDPKMEEKVGNNAVGAIQCTSRDCESFDIVPSFFIGSDTQITLDDFSSLTMATNTHLECVGDLRLKCQPQEDTSQIPTSNPLIGNFSIYNQGFIEVANSGRIIGLSSTEIIRGGNTGDFVDPNLDPNLDPDAYDGSIKVSGKAAGFAGNEEFSAIRSGVAEIINVSIRNQKITVGEPAEEGDNPGENSFGNIYLGEIDENKNLTSVVQGPTPALERFGGLGGISFNGFPSVKVYHEKGIVFLDPNSVDNPERNFGDGSSVKYYKGIIGANSAVFDDFLLEFGIVLKNFPNGDETREEDNAISVFTVTSEDNPGYDIPYSGVHHVNFPSPSVEMHDELGAAADKKLLAVNN